MGRQLGDFFALIQLGRGASIEMAALFMYAKSNQLCAKKCEELEVYGFTLAFAEGEIVTSSVVVLIIDLIDYMAWCFRWYSGLKLISACACSASVWNPTAAVATVASVVSAAAMVLVDASSVLKYGSIKPGCGTARSRNKCQHC